MTKINPVTVTREIDRLRRLHRVIHKGRPFILPEGSITQLDQIERRLLDAVRRDQTGDTVRDGYPSGAVGSGGEDAAQSSTEAAMLAGYRVERNDVEEGKGEWVSQEHDPHHDLTLAALDHLEAAADAVAALMSKLDAIDRSATIHRTDPSGTCNACSRWVEGTAVDRLRSGYCDACRKAWEREGRPDRPTFERHRKASVPKGAVS